MPIRRKKVRISRYIAEYEQSLGIKLDETGLDLSKLKQIGDIHRTKIGWLMHERLIHLLVTMLFAIVLLFVCGMLTVVAVSIPWLILLALVTILLAAYIVHYYQLENTLQRWYVIDDTIVERIEAFNDHPD